MRRLWAKTNIIVKDRTLYSEFLNGKRKPIMYMAEKRSLRIRQRSTTIRLELPFWQALEDIAGNRGMELTTLIAWVEANCQQKDKPIQDKANLASCLRVYCLTQSTHLGKAPSVPASQPIRERPLRPA